MGLMTYVGKNNIGKPPYYHRVFTYVVSIQNLGLFNPSEL